MTEFENKIFGFILNNSLIRHERVYFWLEFFAIVSESLEKLTLEENFKKLIYDSLVDDSESFLH